MKEKSTASTAIQKTVETVSDDLEVEEADDGPMSLISPYSTGRRSRRKLSTKKSVAVADPDEGIAVTNIRLTA